MYKKVLMYDKKICSCTIAGHSKNGKKNKMCTQFIASSFLSRVSIVNTIKNVHLNARQR